MRTGPYRFSNLTSAVRERHSPLRRFLEQRFPDVRALQKDYREGAGPLLVEGGSADPATLGVAFDYLVKFALDADHVPAPALAGFKGDRSALRTVLDVVAVARDASPTSVERVRAVWALAGCTDVYRGDLEPDSAVARLLAHGRFTGDALMSLAPPDALRQLASLREVADERLLPEIGHAGRMSLGPTFAASRLCAADADLIADGLLLELKTYLGRKNPRSGVRSDALARTDVYQLVAYALFDRPDEYRIDRIGVYSARYGHLAEWSLSEALATMAGTTVDLAAERMTVWRMLGGH